MVGIKKLSIIFFVYIFSCFAVSAANIFPVGQKDSIPSSAEKGRVEKKSIYPPHVYKRPRIYNWLIGKHYGELYATPIAAKTTNLYDLYGGLTFAGQLSQLHALFFKDQNSYLYVVRPLGGASTFAESDFFKNIYNRQEFEGTYLNKFIEDAYTITHPYIFMVANKLAENVGVSFFNSEICYIPQHTITDTIVDGSSIEDRLVGVYDLKAFNDSSKVVETQELMRKMQESKSIHVDQDKYIRERLFGLLIGDWNQAKENWKWNESVRGDSIIYTALITDRSHAFTKVDGVLFKPMLSVLGLESITNYDRNIKNLKKANKLAVPLDIALVPGSGRKDWLQEAKYIKSVLSDEVIDNAFKVLPPEIYALPSTRYLKETLKSRRDIIEDIATKYYDILQRTPVLTGTKNDDLFVIDRKDQNTTGVKMYNRATNQLIFTKEYGKDTQEIWLYGLDGQDAFELSGSKKGTPVILIGGKGVNTYSVDGAKKVDIYEYKSHSQANDTLGGAKIISTDIEKVHEYDYKKLKYQTTSFTPWGVYDSDLGFYLGAYFTKTMYGFKRSPYSYQHRIGYNYLEGFMYQGFFPMLNDRKGFTIEAIAGVANSFQNFFGYGNETNDFKDEPNKYNRVYMSKYSINPSFFWKFPSKDKLTASSTFEMYNIHTSTDRYINQVYDANDPVFDPKVFVDFNLIYEIHRKPSQLMPLLDITLIPGWTMNIGDPGRNFPYINSKLAFELDFTDRISMATEVHGIALFSNKYEFYQAAVLNLRGFRNNRFIGRQSLYQHTDLRYDLGHLKNPFTPIQYGVFMGFDYGRVWYPEEDSKRWHTSYGGGFWLTLFKKYTGKFSYFGSQDDSRFNIGFGMGF